MNMPIGRTLVFGGYFALVAVLSVSCSTVRDGKGTVELFDGKTLSGWQCALAEPSVGLDRVWSVRDGMIVCQGDPLGVLYKGPEVANFNLEVEYRWAPGQQPGNSGIFSRIERPVTPLPRAIEVQLKHGDAGQVLGLQGKAVAPGQPRFISIKGHPVAGDVSGVGKTENAERTPGEWNRVVIEARGSLYKVHLNGKLVNQVEGVDVSRGPVGIQSEGGQIHFRKIALTPLD
jgi:hypothetical protein